jgi:hypothetical protein
VSAGGCLRARWGGAGGSRGPSVLESVYNCLHNTISSL